MFLLYVHWTVAVVVCACMVSSVSYGGRGGREISTPKAKVPSFPPSCSAEYSGSVNDSKEHFLIKQTDKLFRVIFKITMLWLLFSSSGCCNTLRT